MSIFGPATKKTVNFGEFPSGWKSRFDGLCGDSYSFYTILCANPAYIILPSPARPMTHLDALSVQNARFRNWLIVPVSNVI